MSDVRTRLVDALRKHNTTPDGECSLCGGFFIDESEWLNHVTDVLLSLPGIAIVEIPTVAHKGPNDTDGAIFRGAAKRLDGGYEPGSSNVKRAISQILRAVANAAERQDKPGAIAPDYAGCSGACADIGHDQ